MQVKNELRKKYKEIRKNVENRNEKNTLIFFAIQIALKIVIPFFFTPH